MKGIGRHFIREPDAILGLEEFVALLVHFKGWDCEDNGFAVPGHRGPHPQAYHQYVFGKLSDATSGLTPNTSAYTNAVSSTLNRIKTEAVTQGSHVNRWLTGG